jgi:hypothetical protein
MPDEVFPIFNNEPLSSLFGVMHFPDDLEKAETFACWWLTATGQSKLADDPERVTQRGAKCIRLADDVKTAAIGGTAVGFVTDAMFVLIDTQGKQATWTDAIYALETTSQSLPVSRSQIEKYQRDFRRVFHFWGAWANLRRSQQEMTDARTLCDRAEMMLQVFREWSIRKDSRILRTDFYRSHWHPPHAVLMTSGRGLRAQPAPRYHNRGRPAKNPS